MKYSISTIVITILAIVIIIFLAFLLYYYSVTPVSVQKVNTQKTSPQPNKVVATNVIAFVSPQVLSEDTSSGNCFASSVAEPYRKDAFRCMVKNGIYDPCFTTTKDGFVFCPIDPSKKDSVVIKLTEALPKATAPVTTKTNWAWFLKLEDGTFCSPFTGTLPPLKNEMAYYGCSGAEGQVLVGDLVQGKIWTVKEGIAAFDGTNWVLKSQKQVNIDTIWQ